MSNKDDAPIDALRETLFKRLAEYALSPMNLPIRMFDLKDRIQESLLELMWDHEDYLLDPPSDVKHRVITHMLDLIALEVAAALLIATENDEFELAVKYAIETTTEEIIKQHKAGKAAREALSEELYEEWWKANPTKSNKPSIPKARSRKDLQ